MHSPIYILLVLLPLTQTVPMPNPVSTYINSPIQTNNPMNSPQPRSIGVTQKTTLKTTSRPHPITISTSKTTRKPMTTFKTTPKTAFKTTPKTTRKPMTTFKTTPKTAFKTTPKTTYKTTPKTTFKTTPKTTFKTTPKPISKTITIFNPTDLAITMTTPIPTTMTATSLEIEAESSSLRTEKCDEIQYDEFFLELEGCYKIAQSDVDEALGGYFDRPALKDAICSSIANKVKCNTNIGPKCWNSTENSNYQNNFLDREMERALNHSLLLGETFLRLCPILIEKQDEVVEFTFGSNACSYVQANEALIAYRVCLAEADLAKEDKLGLIDFVSDKRALIVNALCAQQRDDNACLTDYSACIGEKVRTTIIRKLAEYYSFIDLAIGFPASQTCEFSFAEYLLLPPVTPA